MSNIKNFRIPWSDDVPDVPQLSHHQKMIIPDIQYPLESETSLTLSPFEAVASSWRNDTSGIPQRGIPKCPASTQDGAVYDGFVFPDDVHEDLIRFAQERELETRSDNFGFMPKPKTTKEILGAYDLEQEHARYAFNVLGLNDMHFNYNDLDMYPSPQSEFSADSGHGDIHIGG
jgi:hypothetical protein